MLAAGAARPVRVDPKVALVDLHLFALGQERCDHHLGERRVPAVRRVERGEANEPVDAALGLEEPICVLAADERRRRLEPRLLAGARLDELRLEPTVDGPAQVHPQQHLGPVLRVGAARARRDRDDGVPGVVLAVEERLLPEPCELVPHRGDLLGNLFLERRLQLDQLRGVVDLAPERLVAVELARHAGVLRRDTGRLGLVVPELRGAHPLLELRAPAGQRIRVKGSHGPRRAGPELRELVGDGSVVGGCHARDRSGCLRARSGASNRPTAPEETCNEEAGREPREPEERASEDVVR